MTDKPTRGKPPVSGRFKPGQSGNSRGRPKSKAAPRKPSAIEVILDKTLTVNRDGKPREISVEEALQQRTLQDALEGSRSAQRVVLKWIIKRDRHLAAENQRKAPQTLALRYTSDPGNANEALLLLRVAAPNQKYQDSENAEEHLLLEPWAVRAAQSRRRGAKRLSEKDISEIRSNTGDPDSLPWPKGREE